MNKSNDTPTDETTDSGAKQVRRGRKSSDSGGSTQTPPPSKKPTKKQLRNQLQALIMKAPENLLRMKVIGKHSIELGDFELFLEEFQVHNEGSYETYNYIYQAIDKVSFMKIYVMWTARHMYASGRRIEFDRNLNDLPTFVEPIEKLVETWEIL